VDQIKHCWSINGTWGKARDKCPRLQEVVHCHNCDVFREATKLVYRADIPEEYRQEATRNLREKKQSGQRKHNSVLIVELFDEWIALPTQFIKEIGPYRKIQPIPHNNNPIICGIVNLSGEIEVCFKLHKLLGISDDRRRSPPGFNKVVIAEKGGNRYVFPVTGLGVIYRYHDEQVEDVPATLANDVSCYVSGVIPWRGRDVGLIDAELLFASIDRSL